MSVGVTECLYLIKRTIKKKFSFLTPRGKSSIWPRHLATKHWNRNLLVKYLTYAPRRIPFRLENSVPRRLVIRWFDGKKFVFGKCYFEKQFSLPYQRQHWPFWISISILFKNNKDEKLCSFLYYLYWWCGVHN